MRLARKHWMLIGGVVVTGFIAALMLRPDVYAVETALVDTGLLQITVDEDGVTRVRRHAEIAAPVSGRLAESRVRVGDSVTAGAVVASLSPAPLDPRTREQAGAALEAARALQREAEARVQQAMVALEEARRARRRAETLAAAGAVAARELEAAVDNERIQQRELSAAQSRQRAAAEEERRARLALQGANPSDPRPRDAVVLRAPLSGRVLRVFEEHDRVVPAGTPLLEIGDPRSLEVLVDILTRDAANVRMGAEMLVRVGDAAPLRAHVSRIEPSAFTKVSPLGVEEQRVNVVGQFSEPVLNLGDRFEVQTSIVLWEGQVLRLPTSALVPLDSGWAVFVIDGNRVRMRSVSVGRRAVREVEVTAGLTGGERVVLHPDERLRDGSRVSFEPQR